MNVGQARDNFKKESTSYTKKKLNYKQNYQIKIWTTSVFNNYRSIPSKVADSLIFQITNMFKYLQNI